MTCLTGRTLADRKSVQRRPTVPSTGPSSEPPTRVPSYPPTKNHRTRLLSGAGVPLYQQAPGRRDGGTAQKVQNRWERDPRTKEHALKVAKTTNEPNLALRGVDPSQRLSGNVRQ